MIKQITIIYLILFIIPFIIRAEDFTNRVALIEFAKAQKIADSTFKSQAIAKALSANIPIISNKENGKTIEIIRWDDNKPPMYRTTNNENSAKTISANKVHPSGGSGYNLTGSGITLGIWDAGAVRSTHQEFNNSGVSRITKKDGASNHDHSTHCGGTMIAKGATSGAKGMSYTSSIHSYDWNSDNSEMALAASNDNIKVSNHSYGHVSGWYYNYFSDGLWAWFGDINDSQNEDSWFGYYSSYAQDWDNIAVNAPHYLICKSAGNDRSDFPGGTVNHWYYSGAWVTGSIYRPSDGGTTGYDCMEDQACAKNIITVAAVNDITTGWTKASDVVMSSFSNWGPCDDGRIKPDISANGISLYSSLASSDNAYGSYSGTSMSTPSVAGAIGLLLEHQNNLNGSSSPLLSSTIKGLIIHTANEAGSNEGPDYSFGWGLMNTDNAVKLMTSNNNLPNDFYIQENNLSNGATSTFKTYSAGSTPIKVTICWTDPAGTPVTSNILDNATKMLVNDLDIRLSMNGNTYYPYVLDKNNPSNAATKADNSIDNVEQIYIASPQAGEYSLTVNHKGTLNSTQKYSLIISGLDDFSITLLTPFDNETQIVTNPRLTWKELAGIESYSLQVATDVNFNNIIHNATKIQKPYYDFTQLSNNTQYYWRVKALANDGTQSQWSSVFNFTTGNCGAIVTKNWELTLALDGMWNSVSAYHKPIASILEIRTGSSLMNSTITYETPAMISTDGKITINLKDVADGNYWLVVRVPGYLPLGSTSKIPLSTGTNTYNFRTVLANSAGGTSAVKNANGIYLLRSGDFNMDNLISDTDFTIFKKGLGVKLTNYIPTR